MRDRTKDFFRQFMRNDRWGTCGYCPRDSAGHVYPEFCVETERYDHQLTIADLSKTVQQEILEDLHKQKNYGENSHD